MILCDIGNYSVDFYQNGNLWSMSHPEFLGYKTDDEIFYICVNEKISKRLKNLPNYINIEKYFNFDTIYEGMGIDRIAACMAIKDGVIVDAGSAITVDIMSNSLHLGGYIMPGLASFQKCYAEISERLDMRLNLNVDMEALPQRTVDALSYGVIKPIMLALNDSCRHKMIYFTGGDGKFFSKFFKNSIYDKTLVFKGMEKVVLSAGIFN